jgi:general stress protein YciG
MAKAMTRVRRGSKGQMTVAEAGRKGGLTVRDERGHEFYEEIGRKGGHKVRDLIAAGKRALERK